LEIGEQLAEQLECLHRVNRNSEKNLEALDKQTDVIRQVAKDITSNNRHLEDSLTKTISAQGVSVTVDLGPVLAAIENIDLTPLHEQIDTRYTEISKLVRDPRNLQPVLKAIDGLNLSVDLSPAIESTRQVLEKVDQIIVQQGSLHTEFASCIEAAIPPPIDLTPVLDGITAIDVQPQVNIDLQSIVSSLAAVGTDARADARKLREAFSYNRKVSWMQSDDWIRPVRSTLPALLRILLAWSYLSMKPSSAPRMQKWR
jgi:hypothetical protein